MEIETYLWENKPAIARDYVDRFERVASLYEYDPRDPIGERRRVEWLDRAREPLVDRRQVAEVVAAFNRRIGNAPAAVANAERLADPSALVVVGGQQAVLFTGPLLVLYKAVTILQEARERSARLGRPVVPVFWIAGEDHDWDEVDHTYALTSGDEIRKIRLVRGENVRTSVSRISVAPGDWADGLSQLRGALPDTEHKRELIARLKDVCGRSGTLVDAFARIMAWLFGGAGLVLVDSADPALRRLETPAFERLIRDNERVEAALREGEASVREAGFAPQLDLQPGQAHLCLLTDTARLPLYREGDHFSDRRGAVTLDRSELLDVARSRPEDLSNNVATRPWMQDVLFPVLSAVLGPSEIAYWGLLRPVFRTLGGQMPILVPRLEFTLLDPSVQKQMRRFRLSFEGVEKRFDDKRGAWLRSMDEHRFTERIAEVKRRIAELIAPIARDAASLDRGLLHAADEHLARIGRQLDRFARKTEAAAARRHETEPSRWESIRTCVLPFGKPQERVYNGFVFFNRFGTGWLEELAAADIPRDGRHRIVRL